MRKEYGKALRRIFKKRLNKLAPEFEEIKIADPLYPGQRTYRWNAGNGIQCFITLVQSPKAIDDSFTFEVAWSTLDRLPTPREFATHLYQLTSDRKEFNKPFATVGLGILHLGKDEWWNIGEGKWDALNMSPEELLESRKPVSIEQAETKVQESLDKAMPILEEHGLALLRAFVHRKQGEAN